MLSSFLLLLLQHPTVTVGVVGRALRTEKRQTGTGNDGLGIRNDTVSAGGMCIILRQQPPVCNCRSSYLAVEVDVA